MNFEINVSNSYSLWHNIVLIYKTLAIHPCSCTKRSTKFKKFLQWTYYQNLRLKYSSQFRLNLCTNVSYINSCLVKKYSSGIQPSKINKTAKSLHIQSTFGEISQTWKSIEMRQTKNSFFPDVFCHCSLSKS